MEKECSKCVNLISDGECRIKEDTLEKAKEKFHSIIRDAELPYEDWIHRQIDRIEV